jgi:hypothetical protein
MCIAAAKHFQSSWVRWDRIVKRLLNQDIRLLLEHNASGRSPYLYYLYTRDLHLKTTVKKTGFTKSNPPLLAASSDSIDPRKQTRAEATSENPKSLGNSNRTEWDAGLSERQIADSYRSSHNEKKAYVNKMPEDYKRFNDHMLSNNSKVSDKERIAEYSPIPTKKLPRNITLPDESKTLDNSKPGEKEDTRPSKRTGHNSKPGLRSLGDGGEKHEELAFEAKPIKCNSQALGAENKQPSTRSRMSFAQSHQFSSRLHKKGDLQKKELTVGLEASLREMAYTLGGYQEAFKCLFREQKDGQDMGNGECTCSVS